MNQLRVPEWIPQLLPAPPAAARPLQQEVEETIRCRGLRTTVRWPRPPATGSSWPSSSIMAFAPAELSLAAWNKPGHTRGSTSARDNSVRVCKMPAGEVHLHDAKRPCSACWRGCSMRTAPAARLLTHGFCVLCVTYHCAWGRTLCAPAAPCRLLVDAEAGASTSRLFAWSQMPLTSRRTQPLWP